jgi:hypothetical protein
MQRGKAIQKDRARQNGQIKDNEKAHPSECFKNEDIGSRTEDQTAQEKSSNYTAGKGEWARFHPFEVSMRDLEDTC